MQKILKAGCCEKGGARRGHIVGPIRLDDGIRALGILPADSLKFLDPSGLAPPGVSSSEWKKIFARVPEAEQPGVWLALKMTYEWQVWRFYRPHSKLWLPGDAEDLGYSLWSGAI